MRVPVRCPKLMDALAAGLSRCKCKWMLYGLLTVRYSKHISNCEKKKKTCTVFKLLAFCCAAETLQWTRTLQKLFLLEAGEPVAQSRLRNSWDFFLDCGCYFLSFYLHVASWREQRDSRRPTSCCCVTQRQQQQQQQQARTGLKKKKQQNSFLQKGQKKWVLGVALSSWTSSETSGNNLNKSLLEVKRSSPVLKLMGTNPELLQALGSRLSPAGAVPGRKAFCAVSILRVFSFSSSAAISMRSSLSQQTAEVIMRVVKVRRRWWVLFVNPLLILNIPPSNLPRKHLD